MTLALSLTPKRKHPLTAETEGEPLHKKLKVKPNTHLVDVTNQAAEPCLSQLINSHNPHTKPQKIECEIRDLNKTIQNDDESLRSDEESFLSSNFDLNYANDIDLPDDDWQPFLSVLWNLEESNKHSPYYFTSEIMSCLQAYVKVYPQKEALTSELYELVRKGELDTVRCDRLQSHNELGAFLIRADHPKHPIDLMVFKDFLMVYNRCFSCEMPIKIYKDINLELITEDLIQKIQNGLKNYSKQELEEYFSITMIDQLGIELSEDLTTRFATLENFESGFDSLFTMLSVYEGLQNIHKIQDESPIFLDEVFTFATFFKLWGINSYLECFNNPDLVQSVIAKAKEVYVNETDLIMPHIKQIEEKFNESLRSSCD